MNKTMKEDKSSENNMNIDVFDQRYLKEFEEYSLGVRGISEKFILATGEIEKEIENVISLVLFGQDQNRTNLFKDTIINREFFTIENKFEILTEIINKGEIEFEKNELEGFLEQINEVIKMKKLFLHGDIVISESSVRIHMIEKKIKIGRIIDTEFFNEVNELISGAVEVLRELGEYIEDAEEEIVEDDFEDSSDDLENDNGGLAEVEGELEDLRSGLVEKNSQEVVDNFDDAEEETDEDDEDDEFKVDEADIWKEETGLSDEYTKDTVLDEMPDLVKDVDDD